MLRKERCVVKPGVEWRGGVVYSDRGQAGLNKPIAHDVLSSLEPEVLEQNEAAIEARGETDSQELHDMKPNAGRSLELRPAESTERVI